MFGRRFKINNNTKDEIITTLTKENKRLKIENEAYERKIERVSEIKKEYEELLLKVANLREEYEARLQSLDELTLEYQKELDHITKKAERNVRK